MIMNDTLHYGTDNFRFRKQTLLKSASNIDCSYVTEISGFSISVTQPEDTNIRIIFNVDDHLYKFGNDGTLITYNNRGELADILVHGNTVGELLKVQSIPEWLNKQICLFVAMDAPINAPIMPKIKIALQVNSYNDVYNMTEYSPVYTLGDAKIFNISADKTLRGNAQADISFRLLNNFGEFGDWLSIDDAAYKLGRAIQFRIKYLVTQMDGVDSAKVNMISVDYSPNIQKQAGFFTEIVSKPVEFEQNLSEIAATVYHDELEDCDLSAYVNFSPPLTKRENIILGVTNGQKQTFNLAFNGILDRNINQSSLSIMLGGIGFYDYSFDTQNSTITLQGDKDRTVTASYECGLADELWRDLTKIYTRQEGGRFVSRFVDNFANNEDKRVSAVKFRLTKKNHVGETPEIYKYVCGWAAQI